MGKKRRAIYKKDFTEPIYGMLRSTKHGVIHQIKLVEIVDTQCGEMYLVNIRNKCELNNPNVDVAVLVGSIVWNSPHGPELWYWRDSFWAKGVDKSRCVDYYKNKCYALHQINICNEEELFNNIKMA